MEPVKSETIVYGHKFETLLFRREQGVSEKEHTDIVNAYLEKNPGWGVLSVVTMTGAVHIARKDDMGTPVKKSK